MAEFYLPSKVSELVSIWRNELSKVNQKVVEYLVDPRDCQNFFEDRHSTLDIESKPIIFKE